MNYLGLDWGRRKIGMALGSDVTKIASPILILSYKHIEEIMKKIQQIIIQEEIKVVVVGRPVRLSGEEGVTKEFEKFVQRISALGLEVRQEDERLSTKMAQSIKKQFAGGHKVGDDDIAAAAILQNYFDKL